MPIVLATKILLNKPLSSVRFANCAGARVVVEIGLATLVVKMVTSPGIAVPATSGRIFRPSISNEPVNVGTNVLAKFAGAMSSVMVALPAVFADVFGSLTLFPSTVSNLMPSLVVIAESSAKIALITPSTRGLVARPTVQK